MRDKRLGFILLLILVSIVLPNVWKVKAGSTIYIRADGSIDPVTAPISTVDNILYTLTGDIYDSIVVERNNIVLDGNGYIVQGTGSGTGINLTARENVTIQNTQIKNFENGIRLLQSNNNTIKANTITNTEYGIFSYNASEFSVSGNNVADNYVGIYFAEVSSTLVSGNTIINSTVLGFEIYDSFNSTFSSNTITNSEHGIYFSNASDTKISGNTITNITNVGFALYSSSRNTVYGNTVTNNIIGMHFWNVTNNTVSGNNLTGSTYIGISTANASNCVVTENTLTNNDNGIFFYRVTSSIASKNTVTNSTFYGIVAEEYVSNITIYGNILTDNGDCGIALRDASNITVFGNMVTNNVFGISLSDCSNNTFSGNTLTGNQRGIVFDNVSHSTISGNIITDCSEHGVFLVRSNNSTVSGNMLSTDGGYNMLGQSSYVIVSNNFIVNNAIGFRVSQSSNSTFYHNNFVDNTVQTSVTSSDCTWDDDYPSGGNYWSDYTGRYPGAEELNDSGIWDTPYVINGDNQDDYPLMEPYSYELTITTTAGGTTDPPAGKHYYPAGSLANVTASTNTEYVFDYWLLDSEERVENPISLIMDGNHILEAVFVDVTPPATSNDYDGTWKTSDFTITLSAIDDESGVSETYYRINDGATRTVSVDGQPIIDTEDANNTLQYWSIDNAGNQETPNTLTNIRLDKMAPTSLIDLTAATENNGWFTSDVTMSLSSTDSVSGVDKTEYRLDNNSWETYVSQLTISDEGIFSVYYRSIDKAGNVETANIGTVKLDKTEPQGSIIINENEM
ncbi:MAG: NosD domain-containing protein, partial [Candidatus Bathyarchaeota archaeon]